MPRTLVKPLIEACNEAIALRIVLELVEDRPKRDVLRFGRIGPCQDQEISPAVAFPALVELPTVTHWSIRQRQLNLEFVHPRLTCSLFQELRQCSLQHLRNRSRPCKVPSIDPSSLRHRGGGAQRQVRAE